MRDRLKAIGWVLLFLVVIGWFFHECLFRGYSLVPTDLLHNLMLPYSAAVKQVQVKNHYAMDPLTTDYPLGRFWQQTVRQGELPLWNPYILGGNPNLADSMSAVLSPFKLLYLVLSPERAFTLGIVLEFFLAGLFMFAFLREVGRSRLASFLGAAAWTLSSNLLMWYWRSPGVFCWAPLILLLMERSAHRDSWRYAVGGGLTFGAALLSGNIQTGAHLGFLCAAYGAGMAWWRDPTQRGRTAAKVTVLLAVGVMIAAVHWLPTLELMRLDAYGSTQVRGTKPSVRHTLLGVPALVTLPFPALTGSTETFDLLKAARASRGDFTGYIGIVPFTLVLVGMLTVSHWRVRSARWILATVFVLLFFTPLVKYLYHRFLVVAAFALAFVAAYGADAVLDSPAAAVPRIRRAFSCMLRLCALVAIGLLAAQAIIHFLGGRLAAVAEQYVAQEAQKYAFAHRPDWFEQRVQLFFSHYRLSNVEFWLPLISMPVAAAAWLARQRGRIQQTTLATALVVLTVADLTVLGRRLVPQTDLERYPLQPPAKVLSPLVDERDLFRVYRWGPHAPYIFRPDWLMVFAVHDLSGNFSLAPETLERLPFETNGQFNALLDLANVKYMFTDASFALPAERFELVAEADGVRLYRNPRCLPRLQFYTRWEVVSDRQRILARMREDSFDPREMVFLQEPPAIAPGNGTASIVVERYSANRLIARVNATDAGILLLADTWYPGWKARVDGRETRLFRADHVMRAVEVPAGEHRVEFYFAPATVRIGGIVSLIAAGAAMLAMLFGHLRGRRHNT